MAIFRAGGVMRVVTTAMMTTAEKRLLTSGGGGSGREKSPARRAMSATISSTAPRAFMAEPTASDSRVEKPMSLALAPAPTTLPTVAARIRRMTRPGMFHRAASSRRMPIEAKKIGARNPVVRALVLRKMSL